MKFDDIINSEKIYLYCGDMEEQRREITNLDFIGLTLGNSDKFMNKYHIQHDVTTKMNLKDNTVDIVQSEDVMEHIEYSKLKDSINEIYRVLKPNGLFRLSMPDYACEEAYRRSIKDRNGNIIFDRVGGGRYDSFNKKVIGGGHVWFPIYNSVKLLLESTNFSNDKINFLHYYDENKNPITKKIDYSLGYISRTPDHASRTANPYRPDSIVVDCYK